MDWQQPTALGIVAITAALMAWRRWGRRRGLRRQTGCGSCAAAGGVAPRESVILRARKGHPLEVIVRPLDPPAK